MYAAEADICSDVLLSLFGSSGEAALASAARAASTAGFSLIVGYVELLCQSEIGLRRKGSEMKT